MKKFLLTLICVAFFTACACASPLEDALESCRIETTGLLPDEPGGSVYSSRVLVQEMTLRFLQKDKERFDALFLLLKKYFQSRLMLLYRELDFYLDPVSCENSVSTDIQACQLLIEAAEEWNEREYADWAMKTAGRIRKFNVYREVLVDRASWVERKSGIFNINEVSHVFSLKSVEVSALQTLQVRYPEWVAVAQRSLGILLAGSAHFEMYAEYDIDRRRYEEKRATHNEALWIASNLIEGGLMPIQVLTWVKDKLAKEPNYFTHGDAASFQSSALIVHILRAAGEKESANTLVSLIEKEFATDSGLLCEPGKVPSIYDNLLWLTICEYGKTYKKE